jgi:Uma2 family endonuclease
MADDLRPIQHSPTRAPRAPGPARFEWSDVLAMWQAGIFAENDRVELIEGEVVIMPEEAPIHAMALQVLQRWLFQTMTVQCELYIRGSLQVLGHSTYLIPDLSVLPGNFRAEDRTVATALLIIEVSNTTLSTDIHLKAKLYARAKAKEYWVVDTNARTIIIHRDPVGESFRSVQTIKAGQLATPLCLNGAGFDPATLPDPAEFD